MRRAFALLKSLREAFSTRPRAPVSIAQRREDAANAMRAELLELIGELAASQRWTPKYAANVARRARFGPVSDLLPTLNHFRDAAAFYEAKRQAQEVISRHMKPSEKASSLTGSER